MSWPVPMPGGTLALAAILALSAYEPTHPGGPPPAEPRPQDPAASAAVTDPVAEIDELLADARERHGLPALAALVLKDGAVVAAGAVGRRRVDRDVEVTLADAWHLGSCTKSMTGTLAGVLVEDGAISWTTTVGEVFQDVALHDGWRAATLEQLLSNSGGAPGDIPPALWSRLWEHAGTPVEQRRALVEGMLARPPSAPPGTRFEYSNAGFAIAGAMLETRARKPYEALVQERIFAPLGMVGAGFGAPARDGAQPDQPLGHVLADGAALKPVEPGNGDDNPAAITPAGRVHASLPDWARYAALHLAGARGEELAEPFEGVDFGALHRPRLAGYALGWIASEPDWARGRMLWHNGSNTMWYCEIALFPDENLAVLVATNTAHGTAGEAVSATLRALHARFAPPAAASER